MSKRDCCQALWVSVTGLLVWGLIAPQSPVVSAEEPRGGNVPIATAQEVRVSARVVRGSESLMQEFLNKLPLSPVQIGGPNSGVVNALHLKPESKGQGNRGVPFQQAVLSKEQVTQAVRWIEKHKSLSLTTISPVTIVDGKLEEIELWKGRTADAPPVPQNGILRVSNRQLSEGVKLTFFSSVRSAGKTRLKCEWESTEFVSLKKLTFADPNGKKVAGNLPGAMKCARFQMEPTISDGQTLAVSGFTRKSGTKDAEGLLILLDVDSKP